MSAAVAFAPNRYSRVHLNTASLNNAPPKPQVGASLKGYSLHCIIFRTATDPAMGSGHILVYAFDVLMQIYESYGHTKRDAAKSIVENNLYGLDIDKRAYQLSYFALMMKARQYNRRILDVHTTSNVFIVQESNEINRNHLQYFGIEMNAMERNSALLQLNNLLDTFIDANEYGSILNVENCNWELLTQFTSNFKLNGQLSVDIIGIEDTKTKLIQITKVGKALATNYEVVITNPPYMGSNGMGDKLGAFVKQNYPNSKMDMFAVFVEKILCMTKSNHFVATIIQPSFISLGSFEKLRKQTLSMGCIETMLHMGRGIFGIDFGSTSFVQRKSTIPNFIGNYSRLHDRTFQFIDPSDIEKLYLLSKGDKSFTFDFSTYNTTTENLDENEVSEQSAEIKLFYE
ncbi:MAG: hypothetical protein PHF82_07665 [Lutispora sp.]|nr:hypothetical protein [Lutispora sp.]